MNFALLLVLAPAAMAVSVTLSGKVADTGGNGLYALVIAYRSSDRVVAGKAYSTGSGTNVGNYSLVLPPGTYDFYVRSFGSLPIEDRNVSVPADLTRNFTINTSADRSIPATLKSSAASPQFVFVSTPGSTSTYTLTATTNLGTTVSLFNEFASFTVDGQNLGTIDLYDDATHGDKVAGDHVYTRAGIGFGGSTDFRCSNFAPGTMLYARSSSSPAIFAVPNARLIGVKPGTVTPHVVDAKTQYTAHAANIVFDTSHEGFQKEAAKQFYKSFADVYDFLYFIPETSIVAAGFNQRVRNDVTGIGQTIFDDSLQYGSAGRLRSILLINISEDPPLLHETMHTWANSINPPFDATYLGHWGYSGVNGTLGGFDASKLVANPDGSFTVPSVATNGTANDYPGYAPFELYLAGFAPVSAVPTVPVFVNPQFVNGDPNHFRGTRTDVSGADIVTKYGPRNPSVAAAPKRFRIAVVGVTSTPMTNAGMTYLNVLAEQLSGVAPTCAFTLSFAEATNGAASMDATIQPISGAPRHHAVRH